MIVVFGMNDPDKGVHLLIHEIDDRNHVESADHRNNGVSRECLQNDDGSNTHRNEDIGEDDGGGIIDPRVEDDGQKDVHRECYGSVDVVRDDIRTKHVIQPSQRDILRRHGCDSFAAVASAFHRSYSSCGDNSSARRRLGSISMTSETSSLMLMPHVALQ